MRLCRDTQIDEKTREAYRTDKRTLLSQYNLTTEELESLTNMDVKKLYQEGVPGLFLWHLAILEKMPQQEYLKRIRS
jgi:hypothetical protein